MIDVIKTISTLKSDNCAGQGVMNLLRHIILLLTGADDKAIQKNVLPPMMVLSKTVDLY